jgi:hypothetical protein
LGEFQSCALFSPMERFNYQSEATQTARASLIALMQPAVASVDPFTAKANADAELEASAAASVASGAPALADKAKADAPTSPSRRRFFGPFVRGASGS